MADFTEGKPGINDTIRAVVAAEMAKANGVLPAKVVSYDAAKQLAEVQPVVLVVIKGVGHKSPVLRDVPVRWPSAANGSLVLPLVKDDLGDVVPMGADTGAWDASGTENQAQDRNARDALSDVVFRPGGSNLAARLASGQYAADGPVLWGDPVYLGDSTATAFVALADLVATELGKIETAVNAHTHAFTAQAGADPLTTSPAVSYTKASVAADKVKAT